MCVVGKPVEGAATFGVALVALTLATNSVPVSGKSAESNWG